MKSKTRRPLPAPDLGERLNMTAWRKHYVSSVTAGEEAWPQREPGSNLGRIFVLLLLLHVFIIGAVVLYNIVSPKAPMAMRTDAKPLTVNKPSVTTETASTAAKAVTPAAKPTTAEAAPQQPAKIEPPTAPKPVDGLLTYEVKSGDNVPGIAFALGVNAEDLVKLNNLDSTELYPGRKLEYRKPSIVPLVATPTTTSRLQPASLSSNTVTSATTKPRTVEPLKMPDKEKASSDSLPKAKPQVNVPDSSPDSVPKAVPIKSLASVEDQPPPAKKMKSSSDEPPAAKSKAEPKPKNEEAKAKKPKTDKTDKSDKSESSSKTASKTDKSSAGKRTHIVGAHETLYSISRKFGVSVSALQKANDIKDPTRLRDGSKLVIPAKS